MTKSTSEQGQISIFFSASLVVLVSIIAFVVNVGLFVKAKINLQNSTDAAAFAGAAVQARQLTKIAHLNWEMRNIYKEWMYKYYVVGNLNIEHVKSATSTNSADPMSFRMLADRNAISGEVVEDPYNIPAVCIHLEGSQTNICRRFAIPGLPEFGSSNLPGAEEASRAFMDTLIGTKIDDCIDRTKFNMLVASTWSYNVTAQNIDDTLLGRGPAILADRQGAWPQAVELALRIRNLEYIMNRPAHTQSVCLQAGVSDKINCARTIAEVTSENMPGNERMVKAFYSGFRNIGGSYEEDEMKNTFTLTEIPPRPVNLGNKENASYLLVPDKKMSYEKQFVDLKLMMVNYAIFYAAMIPRADSQVSGACDVTKAAVPVPGYPMGFYKNPDILTYYAVKGEAEYVGMFNPFGDSVKLTAYAAAKPFGGRIGPMLFNQPDGRIFYGRKDPEKKRSVPYMTTLDVVGTPQRRGAGQPLSPLLPGEYAPGAPLPINSPPNSNFWIEDPSKPVGGLVTESGGVQFGIPNLVYDYQTPFSDAGYTLKDDNLHKIQPKLGISGDKSVGLFSKYQFARFRGDIGDTMSPEQLDAEIARVRAPTLYEAANYLVPTPQDVNFANKLDSFGFISGNKRELSNEVSRYPNYIYAPLYDANTDILFSNPSEVITTIFDFMRAQESGLLKYRNSLNKAAVAIYKMSETMSGSAVGSAPKYKKAAEGVSDINLDGDPESQFPASCQSINGQFLNFYYGHDDLFPNWVTNKAQCPAVNLGELLIKYFSNGESLGRFRASHYLMNYSWYKKNFPSDLSAFTAYTPGTFTGVQENGMFDNPIPGSAIEELMRRNFYSTKFISLDSIKGGRGYSEAASRFLIFSEGDVQSTNLEVKQNTFLNVLQPSEIGSDDLSSIKH